MQPKPEPVVKYTRPDYYGENLGLLSAADMNKMNFKVLEFDGAWEEFIGKPAKNFYAIIYAKPKQGKSHLAMQFAKYLSFHGEVLYDAAEEGFGLTLQKKIKASEIYPDDPVDFTDVRTLDKLEAKLKTKHYDFVFIDSINVFKIEPDQFEVFRKRYPNTAFINIMQSTKTGSFRGSQEWTHNCDIIITFEDIGKAVQNGRFGSGEFQVFKSQEEPVSIDE